MTLLETTSPLLIGVIALAIICTVLLILVIMMHLKLKKFLVDVNAHNIAESLAGVSSNLDDLKKFRTEIEDYLTTVEKRLRKSVQSVETVRFNPFHGTGGGGNQSFATAFVTEDGDGVVISSLYSRDHVSVFSKPLKNHQSQHELSEEENQALENAKKGLK